MKASNHFESPAIAAEPEFQQVMGGGARPARAPRREASADPDLFLHGAPTVGQQRPSRWGGLRPQAVHGAGGLGMAGHEASNSSRACSARASAPIRRQGAGQGGDRPLVDPARQSLPKARQVAGELFDPLQQGPAVQLKDMPGEHLLGPLANPLCPVPFHHHVGGRRHL